jgi:hypothetical protein
LGTEVPGTAKMKHLFAIMNLTFSPSLSASFLPIDQLAPLINATAGSSKIGIDRGKQFIHS